MSDYEMIEAIQCELGRYSEELVPVGDGKVTLLQGTVIKFPMLTTQEGNSVYPAFTDWEELAKWSSITLPPQTLILSFDDYVSMVLQKEKISSTFFCISSIISSLTYFSTSI